MISAVIIDDESHGVKSLSILLKRFVPEINVVATELSPSEGLKSIEKFKPQLVFLDISMPEMDGFELLNQLSFRNFYLIFTTAHKEYGLKAIKQSALDYLLKPIDTEDLLKAIQKVKNDLAQKNHIPDIKTLLRKFTNTPLPKVLVPTKEGIENISSEDILCIEAQSNHCRIFLKSDSIIHSIKMLKDFETQLCKPEFPFFRVHNSFIINVNFINKYIKEDGGQVVLNSNKKIPISKHKKEELMTLIDLKL